MVMTQSAARRASAPETIAERERVGHSHRTRRRETPGAAMPLIYLPLIMYASWMEMLAHPFEAGVRKPERKIPVKATSMRRSARGR